MPDFKDQMIEAVERGWATEYDAADFVADTHSVHADILRDRMKEAGRRNPLVADMFCITCHYTENAHPHARCTTGFVPGDPEAVREENRKRGFPC